MNERFIEGRMYNPEELETQTAWIAGSKHKSEQVFFHQIVYKLQHKQRLWDFWSKNGIDYFFIEIEIPFRLNKETAPF